MLTNSNLKTNFLSSDCRRCAVTVTPATSNTDCTNEYCISKTLSGLNSWSPQIMELRNGEIFVTYYQLCKTVFLTFNYFTFSLIIE